MQNKTFASFETVLSTRAEELQKKFPRRRLYLVFQGDYGGQIYLTVPWAKVGPNAKIDELLETMDRCRWHDQNGASAYIYDAKPGEMGIAGGMGGLQLTDSLCLHFTFWDRQRYPIMEGRPGHDELGRTDWQQLASKKLDIR